MKLAAIILLTAAAPSLFGCVAWVNYGEFDNDAPFTQPSASPPYFNLPREQPIEFTGWLELNEKETSYYKAFQFNFVCHINNEWEYLWGTLYFPKRERSGHLFLVMKGLGDPGASIPECLAERLACHGYLTAYIRSEYEIFPPYFVKDVQNGSTPKTLFNEWAVSYTKFMRRRACALMALIDFLEKKYFIQSFHAVGYSMGGVTTALLAGADPRIKSLLMFNACGTVGRIILDAENSGVEEIQAARELIFKRLKWNRRRAETEIKNRLQLVEPNTYANRINPRRVLMITSCFDLAGLVDTAIPLSAVWETWKALGRPEWIELPFAGHVSASVALLPFWIELPSLHFITFNSYLNHIIDAHFLPKAIRP